MTAVITRLDSPIDAMYPIHNALRAEAAGAEQLVRQLEPGGSLQAFEQTFRRWFRALEFHAVREDTSMTPLFPERPSARDNEAEHKHLTELLAAVQTFLQETPRHGAVTARVQRHLLGKVVTLRVAQDDHLENEEELILPLIRQRLCDTQQGAVARRLLLDDTAQDVLWVLDWVALHVPATASQALSALLASCVEVPALV